MRFSVRRAWNCQAECTCRCHVRKSFQSPQFLNRLLGKVFIGYSGQFLLGTRCSEPLCQKYSTSSLDMTVTYLFPLWFIARAVSSTVSLSMGSPEFGLKLPRVITADRAEYKIYRMAALGNTAGIRTMIESGYVTPNDISHPTGSTMLFVSRTQRLLGQFLRHVY